MSCLTVLRLRTAPVWLPEVLVTTGGLHWAMACRGRERRGFFPRHPANVGAGFGETGVRQVFVAGQPEMIVEPPPGIGPVGAVGETLGNQRGEFSGLLAADGVGQGCCRLASADFGVEDVQDPLAEFLGNGGAGEHRQQVSAAQGEDANLAHLTCFRRLRIQVLQLHYSGHLVGEFVGVKGVDVCNAVGLAVTQGYSNLL